jgi:hypothetical protein
MVLLTDLAYQIQYLGLDGDIQAVVGSSASRSAGPHTNARAINACCCIPRELVRVNAVTVHRQDAHFSHSLQHAFSPGGGARRQGQGESGPG